jgi:hypothetical protein
MHLFLVNIKFLGIPESVSEMSISQLLMECRAQKGRRKKRGGWKENSRTGEWRMRAQCLEKSSRKFKGC